MNHALDIKPVIIGGRPVGPGEPVFVIAEGGVNHNGDVALAHRLIDAARDSGVDCIKFQTFKAERVVTPSAPKAAYQLETTDPGESQIAMLRALELDERAYPALMDACRAAGLVFMSTPYNEEDIDFLVKLDVPALKLASIQAAEPSLLKAAASTGRPLILSTGMCVMDEVKRAVEIIHGTGNRDLIVLQCTTNYPSAIADTNLKAMVTMRDHLGVRVGYSDHTQTDTACIAAVALGACVIEKHFTLDKTMPGPDQVTSLEPAEMSALVQTLRDTEAALGDGLKRPAASETRNMAGMRRGIVARHALAKGHVLTANDLILKRPLSEVPPTAWDTLIGRKTARAVEAGTSFRWADVEGGTP